MSLKELNYLASVMHACRICHMMKVGKGSLHLPSLSSMFALKLLFLVFFAIDLVIGPSYSVSLFFYFSGFWLSLL